MGAGSVLAGLIGAFPVNASPPRTAVVSESGGRSQIAGLVAALLVGLLVLLAPGFLPICRRRLWPGFCCLWRSASRA